MSNENEDALAETLAQVSLNSDGEITLDDFRTALYNNFNTSRLIFVIDETNNVVIQSREVPFKYSRSHPFRGEDYHIWSFLQYLLLKRHPGNDWVAEELFSRESTPPLSAELLRSVLVKSDGITLRESMSSEFAEVCFVVPDALVDSCVRACDSITRFLKSNTIRDKDQVLQALRSYEIELTKLDEVQHPPRSKAVVKQMLTSHILSSLDFTTKQDAAVFWTGFKIRNNYTAQIIARKGNQTTLEMTKGGRLLNELKLFESELDPAFLGSIFEIASARFARGATGKVRCVIYEKLDVESVFAKIEKPILLQKLETGEVSDIQELIVDPEITKPLLDSIESILRYAETGTDWKPYTSKREDRKHLLRSWSNFFSSFSLSRVAAGEIALQDIYEDVKMSGEVNQSELRNSFISQVQRVYSNTEMESALANAKNNFQGSLVFSDQSLLRFVSEGCLSEILDEIGSETGRLIEDAWERLNQADGTHKEFAYKDDVDNIALQASCCSHRYAAEIAWLKRAKTTRYEEAVSTDKKMDRIRETFIESKIKSVIPWIKYSDFPFSDCKNLQIIVDFALDDDLRAMRDLEVLIEENDPTTKAKRNLWNNSDKESNEFLSKQQANVEHTRNEHREQESKMQLFLHALDIEINAWKKHWPVSNEYDIKVSEKIRMRNSFLADYQRAVEKERDTKSKIPNSKTNLSRIAADIGLLIGHHCEAYRELVLLDRIKTSNIPVSKDEVSAKDRIRQEKGMEKNKAKALCDEFSRYRENVLNDAESNLNRYFKLQKTRGEVFHTIEVLKRVQSSTEPYPKFTFNNKKYYVDGRWSAERIKKEKEKIAKEINALEEEQVQNLNQLDWQLSDLKNGIFALIRIPEIRAEVETYLRNEYLQKNINNEFGNAAHQAFLAAMHKAALAEAEYEAFQQLSQASFPYRTWLH